MAITRTTTTIDAKGRSIGRIATEAARLLQGKHKPTYQPNVDAGDVVEVLHASQVRITGDKLEGKNYYHYSGYPGGMKTVQLKTVMAKDPADAIRRAVKNMLPKNRLQMERLKRLKVSN